VRVAQLVHAVAPAAPVIACSRWWPGLEPFADLPWVRPVLTARTPFELRRVRRRLAGGRHPYGVSLHRSLLTPTVVAGLRAQVDVVMTWGVNDTRALAEVVGLGVNGVISDEADVLRRVLARR
jgi:glycerophosphoryl diester phosphodiesterase